MDIMYILIIFVFGLPLAIALGTILADVTLEIYLLLSDLISDFHFRKRKKNFPDINLNANWSQTDISFIESVKGGHNDNPKSEG